MTVEQVAALAWRFIGLFALVTALPGLVLVAPAMLRSGGHFGGGAPLAWLLIFVQVIVGLLVLRYSKSLGRIIARGL